MTKERRSLFQARPNLFIIALIFYHVALGDQVFSELTLLLVLSKDAPVCVYTHGGTRLSSSNHR